VTEDRNRTQLATSKCLLWNSKTYETVRRLAIKLWVFPRICTSSEIKWASSSELVIACGQANWGATVCKRSFPKLICKTSCNTFLIKSLHPIIQKFKDNPNVWGKNSEISQNEELWIFGKQRFSTVMAAITETGWCACYNVTQAVADKERSLSSSPTSRIASLSVLSQPLFCARWYRRQVSDAAAETTAYDCRPTSKPPSHWEMKFESTCWLPLPTPNDRCTSSNAIRRCCHAHYGVVVCWLYSNVFKVSLKAENFPRLTTLILFSCLIFWNFVVYIAVCLLFSYRFILILFVFVKARSSVWIIIIICVVFDFVIYFIEK